MKKVMRKNQKGSMLLEGLVAISLFTFGALGTMSFQANQLAQTAQTTAKLEASMLVNSLIGAAEADSANYACYTYPAVNSTSNCDVATAYVTEWASKLVKIKAVKILPPTSTLDSANNLVVTVSWTDAQSKTTKNITSIIHPVLPI